MDKTNKIKQFIFNAGHSIVSVEFIKADGSLRKIQFNPWDTKEIKGTGTASTKLIIVRCRDFSIARKEGEGAWRSFDSEHDKMGRALKRKTADAKGRAMGMKKGGYAKKGK